MPHGIVNKRQKPEVKFLNGFFPENSLNRALNAPVIASEVDFIKSGMVVSLIDDSGVQKWTRGLATGRTPYIAVYDAADPIAQSPGNLLAIPMSDQILLLTGYVAGAAIDAASFPLDLELSAYPNTDATNKGNLKIASTGEVIVGRISNTAGNAGGTALTQQSDWARRTDSSAVDPKMISVATSFDGRLKA